MTDVVLKTVDRIERQCGECQLCCRLLPVRALGKGANTRCRHQKFGKGCAVYHQAAMPPECMMWNSRWLVNDDTGDLPRPDRSHYVIDIMPDFITVRENATGATQTVEVIQIWLDPKYPDAHRDPALRAYLARRALEGKVGLVRTPSKGFVLAPPAMSEDGQWHEIDSMEREAQHSFTEIVQALGGA
jgi:hypothetical protein